MIHYYRPAAAAVLSTVLVLTSCHNKSADKHTADYPAPTVSVETPTVKSVMLHQTYPAYTYAVNKVKIVGRVNGVQTAHDYAGGDHVAKGAVLFHIEPTLYADAVRQAEASLSTAKSQYEYASRQYAAMTKALESDAVSAMDVVQAKSSMQQAEASIKSSEAALNDARTKLGYCTVYAPMSGRVIDPIYSDGTYISGEGAPVQLATIYDDSKIVVQFNVEETQYRHMIDTRRTNDSIYNNIPVEFRDGGTMRYYATLSYMDPSVDPSTGTFIIKTLIDNGNGPLREGMYATVSLPVGYEENAILIKDSSISTDQQGKYVYTVNDSNRVVYTPIKVGELYQDSLRIVADGLTPQSRYVTSALLKVRDGMEVNPVSDKK